MIPGGGSRILGIHELFVENNPFDLVGKLAYLVRISGPLKTFQQGRKGLVRGVGLWVRRVFLCQTMLPRHTYNLRERRSDNVRRGAAGLMIV